MNPQSAAANPLKTQANQSRFALRVQGLSADTFAVKSFSGKNHALDQDYLFEVFVQSSEVLGPGRVVGQGASFELLRDGAEPVVVPGVIRAFGWAGSTPGGREYLATLASPLYPLKLRTNHRIFLNRSVPQIIEEVLAEAGLGAAAEMALKDEYPLREYTVQYDESDWDFVTRLAAASGIFFRIEADRKNVRICFHDAVDELPFLPTADGLHFQVQTGAVRDRETIFAFNTRAEVLTDGVDLRDYNYRTPESLLDAPASRTVDVPGHGRAYRFGENHKDLDQGRKLARLRQQKLDWQRQLHIADSDCRAAAPGLRLTMTDHPDAALNGDYLIVAVDHQGHQGSGFAYGAKAKGMSYRNRLTLVPFATPYRPKLPEQRLIHGVFTARIETTGGPYACLDEQGRYRVRLDLDAGDAAAGQASHAARLMQSYAGDTFGSHMPLHAGAEVALTCVNGDLDRPVILGVLPNPQTASPVNAANPSQNILRTFGDNELLMEDRKGQERIELFTRDRNNLLNLDAKADGHKVRLATLEGEMEIYAAKTMLKESGDTHSTVAGDNHLITVENNQRLSTKNKAIELQAATDIRIKAADNVRLQAEKKDIQLRADKDMVVRAGEGMSVEVRNQNLSLLVKNGELSIEVAKEINILGQGGGAITLAQSGGEVTIAPGGAVTIASHTVDINGQSVSMGGSQNSQGGAGGGAGAGEAAENGPGFELFAQLPGALRNFFAPQSSSGASSTAEPEPQALRASSGSPAYGTSTGGPQAASSSPTANSTQKVDKPELVIGVFFDGTGNNKDAEPPERHTNVAKLWELYESLVADPIYIQGVGTKAVNKEMKISLLGKGMGIGIYGGGERLREARKEVFEALKKYHASYGLPEVVTFDVFGFSRGAMLARHFVNMVNAGLPDLQAPPVEGTPPVFPDLRSTAPRQHGVSPTQYQGDEPVPEPLSLLHPRLGASVRVRFLGIYDSVGSFFKPGDADEGYVNPYLAPSSAGLVYHLTARNEIRKNFPLTRICDEDGACPPNFIEEELFGVHSDIGGGYDGEPEVFYIADEFYQPDPRHSGDSGTERSGEDDPEWMARMRRKAKQAGCQVRFEGDTACFFEIRPTKPELALVALHAMHAKAVTQGVPLEKIKDVDAIPQRLTELVTRAQNGDNAAFKKLDELYIHTSHRKFLLVHLGETIGMAPAMDGLRRRLPNRPGQAIPATVVNKRTTQ